MSKVYVYKDAGSEWRWHRVEDNGHIVSDSAEGYKNRQHCLDMATKLNQDAEVIVRIQSSDITGVESMDDSP